ncbi:phosphosulfolactate synthase [Shinella sp. S4-D37]|uniref:phosphosulfolactate synthase n=1 Tax=Shinella sp. S4-D37 TaxID=3161999 RepID=UPI0034665671
MQNKVAQFFERAADLGLSGVEVSEDVIDPQSAETRSAHIRLAASSGLFVFTEVGRKFPDAPLDVDAIASLAARDLDAGASKIVVENSDIVQIVERDSDELHRLAERIPLEKLVFEIGPAGGAKVAAWLFRAFGPEVNIENLDLRDVGTLAAQRAGLHRSVGLTFFDRYTVAAAAE